MSTPRFLAIPHLLAVAFSLLVGGIPLQAQDLLVSDFDDEDAVAGVWDWWGGAAKEITWSTDDAADDANSGSLNLSIGFDNTIDDNQYAIAMSLAGTQWSTAVLGSSETYKTLAFDVRWNDASTASLDAFNTGPGDPAFLVGLATSDWGQTWMGSVELTDEGWQRVEIDIPAGTPDFPGIVFKKWSPGGGDDTGLSGIASISIDNVQLIAGGGDDPLAGEVELLSGFDEELTSSGFWTWWGGTFQEYFWDETADADGNAESGAIKINVEFDNTLDDNQYAIGWSLSGLGGFNSDVVASAADYAAVAFDVKWDAESTIALDDFNNSGADPGFHMGFASTGWTQSWISNAPGLTADWQRMVIPIDSATPDIAGLVFKKWQQGGGNPDALNGTASFWIDNISLIRLTEEVPPPTLSLERAVPKGLRLIASTTGQQFQRQNIHAIAAEDTVWFENPNTVSYSISFADFPGADAPGFQAHLFIAPDSLGGGSPDWSDPNVIFIDFGSDGTNGTCNVRYKVDEPNGNSMIYGAGTLGAHTAESILGTWTISFSNDTDITVSSPDETESVFTMPQDDAAKFEPDGTMNAYFGIQPNQLANIGQSATFSRITITDGENIVLDDKFETVDETQKVDFDNWIVNAASEALWVINSDSAYWLNWTLPAPNFELFTSPTLGSPDEWELADPLPGQIGSIMTVLMQGEDLPGAEESYFRLQVVEPEPEEEEEEGQ